MGSKEEDVPKEPVEKTVFVEDMNESELATAVSNYSKTDIFFNIFFPNEFHYLIISIENHLTILKEK